MIASENRILLSGLRSIRSVRTAASTAFESFAESFDIEHDPSFVAERVANVDRTGLATKEIDARAALLNDLERSESQRLMGMDTVDNPETLARIRDVFPADLEAITALSNDPDYRGFAARLGRAPDPYVFCTVRLMELAAAA